LREKVRNPLIYSGINEKIDLPFHKKNRSVLQQEQEQDDERD